MKNDSFLLQTTGLQTGYRSGKKKIVVAGALPDLEIKAGQLICLLGPNGSGKSTLLRTLAGLQPSLGGTISIDGMDRWTPKELARKISLVLTDRVRGNNLTAYSLVALGRYPYSGWLGKLSAVDNAVIDQAIDATGIGALKDRKIHTLSDGENQKVMLARALAQDTPLLMLDEPTAHLDLPSRIRLMRLLHQLAGEFQKGILLSTHELDLALQVADEVWLLQSGGILHRGAPEDLVLNGIFERVFSGEDITFDKESGTFIIHSIPANPVLLTGEGVAAFWTQRALRRAGYAVVTPAGRIPPAEVSCHIRILDNQGLPGWQLETGDGTSTHTSIESLLSDSRLRESRRAN